MQGRSRGHFVKVKGVYIHLGDGSDEGGEQEYSKSQYPVKAYRRSDR